MLVTVLMSTYNGEKYLSQQLESILSQTYPNIRIFVRDDNSQDNTQSILQEYASVGLLSYYTSDQNLGAGKSFFDLVTNAPDSEYYAFADQDDVWLPNKIEVGVTKLLSYSEDVPSLYCSLVTPVDQRLKFLNVGAKKTKSKPCLCSALLEGIAAGCTYVFNRKALELFREYKIEFIDIHDWAFYRILAAVNANIFFDLRSFILYRQHNMNTIGFQNRNIKHWFLRIKRLCNISNLHKYSKAAHYIKIIYKNKITENNLELIETLENYRFCMRTKIKFLKTHQLYMSRKIDTLCFYILVIFNMA